MKTQQLSRRCLATVTCLGVAIWLLPAPHAQGANGSWTGNTDSTWATTTNWSGASAPTTNELATFNGAGNGNTTINLGTGVTIRSVEFDTAGAAAYTIGAGAVGSQTLTLNVAGWNQHQGGIWVNSTVTNNQLFNANLVLGTATLYGHYIRNNSTAATLTLAGNVAGGTGGTAGAKTLYLGGNGNTVVRGVIGTGGATSLALNKTGAGTVTLAGTNTYAGATTINQGNLDLDFSAATAPPTNIISATGGALTFTGGTLRLTGKPSTVNSQAMGATTVGTGASSLSLTANSATSLLLNLKAISRSAGGTLDLSLPTGTQSSANGVITTTTHLANSVLVSAASNGIAYATVGGTDWAGLSTGNIVAMTTYQTGNANYTTNNNVDVTNGDTPASGITVNTLRFNGNNTLNLSGTNTVNTGGLLVTSAANTGASIAGGTLRSGGGRELVLINNGAQLTVGSDIADSSSGASALTLSGTGTTILSGTNTYTGATFINNGTVKAGSAQALGVNSNVTLGNSTTAVLDLNGNNLTIGALNAGGNLIQPVSPNNYGTINLSAASVALGSNTLTVGAGNASSTFGGSITGAGGSVVKIGTGSLTLDGSNSFGAITVKAGTLNAAGYLSGGYSFGSGGAGTLGSSTITLGDADGGSDAVTLKVGGINNSVMTYTNSLVLTGTNALTLTKVTPNTTIGFNGAITGTNNLTITNPSGGFYVNGNINFTGDLTASGVHSFTGTIGPNVGNVTFTAGGTTFQLGTINNSGTFTLTNPSGAKTALGTLGANVTGLIFNGLTGSQSFELTNSTFVGNTLINSGTLKIMNNLSLQNSGIDTTGAGVIDATSHTMPTFGGLIGSKDIASVITTGYSSITALTLNPQAGKSYSYSGAIGDGAVGMTLTKTGLGTQVLAGSNTYTGNTSVNAGALLVNGSIAGNASVANGATLGGNGMVGGRVTVTNGATLAPGMSPGVLSAGELDLREGSVFAVDLLGADVGTGYDQVRVTGNWINLADGAILDLNLGYRAKRNQTFLILRNDGSDSQFGGVFTFAGTPLNEGDTFMIGAYVFDITYAHNDGIGGNDILLTVLIPEPASALLLALGGLALLKRRR